MIDPESEIRRLLGDDYTAYSPQATGDVSKGFTLVLSEAKWSVATYLTLDDLLLDRETFRVRFLVPAVASLGNNRCKLHWPARSVDCRECFFYWGD